jgi:hypothetical protein
VEFNKRYGTGAVSWEEIVVEEKEITRRLFTSSSSGYLGRFRKFKEQTPLWQRLFVDPDGCFVNSELIPSAGGDLAKFNGLNGTSYQAWTDIRLPSECTPEGHHLREPWLRYARAVLNIHQLGLTDSALPAFRAMLKDKYGSIGLLNLTWKLDLSSFEQVTIPQQLPDSGALVEDLSFFIQNQAQPEQIRVHSLAHNWRDWLRRKYGSLASLNLARRDSLPSWDAIAFPVREMDYFSFLERKAAIRWEFISRNYKMALDQMLSDARSLRNTGIYVLLSILLAVTVNPWRPMLSAVSNRASAISSSCSLCSRWPSRHGDGHPQFPHTQALKPAQHLLGPGVTRCCGWLFHLFAQRLFRQPAARNL